jgi:cytidylate kinase
MVIAIDGPAGAGKSTVARQAALALGYDYLDTGAMYRAVAWRGWQNGIAETDEAELAAIAETIELRFGPLAEDGSQRVYVGQEDVTEAIRVPEVSRLVSPVSAHPAVRRALVGRQREIGRQAERGVVLEGRDIGTVVFPDAPLKVFLTATPEERARRRHAELEARGLTADFAAVFAEQNIRDTRDSQRADSPLKPAPDAVEIVTDGLTVEDVVTKIVSLLPPDRQML